MNKVCSKCKISLDVSDFNKNKIRKDGMNNWCKLCCKDYRSKHTNILRRQDYQSSTKYKCKHNAYNKQRYNTDSSFKLCNNLRSRISKFIVGSNKSLSTTQLIGCSIKELKLYLQQTAINNGYTDFNIENYSGQEYHIDHIKPCASYDLSNPEEQKICFHYSNLQILTADENMKKGKNH